MSIDYVLADYAALHYSEECDEKKKSAHNPYLTLDYYYSQ